MDSILVQTGSLLVMKYITMTLEGYLKVGKESEKIAAQDQALQTQHHETKILKTETANADYVHNTTRQETTLPQRAQYWQKNDIQSDVKECVCSTILEHMQANGGKIRKGTLVQAYTKSVETCHEGKATIFWKKQVQTDRIFRDHEQDRQCTYNVTPRRVRATLVTVEMQYVLHVLNMCL